MSAKKSLFLIFLLFILKGFIIAAVIETESRSSDASQNCLEETVATQRPELTTGDPLITNPHPTPKWKRCARRGEVVALESSVDEPVLTMTRRDTNEQALKRCEKCRKSVLCKDPKRCKIICRPFCKDFDNDTEEATVVIPELTTETNEIKQLHGADVPEMVVGARFGDQTPSHHRYYSLGAFSPGPSMNLVAKLLGVTDVNRIHRLVVLAETGVSQAPAQNPDIVDTAKVFSQINEMNPQIHRVDGKTIQNPDLMVEFNKAIDQAIENRQKNGESNQKLYDNAIQDALRMMYDNSTFADVLGCKLEDKIEDELVPLIIPPYNNAPPSAYPKNNEHQDYQQHNLPSNPLLIEDSLDPNLESRVLTTATPTTPTKLENTLQSENQIKHDSSEEGGSSSTSISDSGSEEDFITKPITTTTPEPISVNVLNMVQENLNQTEQDIQRVKGIVEDMINKNDNIAKPSRTRPIGRQRPQAALGERRRKLIPQKTTPVIVSPNDGEIIGAKKNPPQDTPKVPAVNPVETNKVGADNPLIDDGEKLESPKFDSRNGDTPLESSPPFDNFGMVVPDRTVQDPNSKTSKVYFVGNGINLPLQMLKQNDGSLQLSVDVDKMCNCKNKTCTKPHVLNTVGDDSIEQMPLTVRFGEVINREPNKLSEINPPPAQSEKSDISKRSARVAESANDQRFDEVLPIKNYNKLKRIEEELENKLNELNKNVRDYYNDDREELEPKNERSERSIRNRMDMLGDFLKLIKRATL